MKSSITELEVKERQARDELWMAVFRAYLDLKHTQTVAALQAAIKVLNELESGDYES